MDKDALLLSLSKMHDLRAKARSEMDSLTLQIHAIQKQLGELLVLETYGLQLGDILTYSNPKLDNGNPQRMRVISVRASTPLYVLIEGVGYPTITGEPVQITVFLKGNHPTEYQYISHMTPDNPLPTTKEGIHAPAQTTEPEAG